MKNYIVTIFDKETNEQLTEYNIEEETYTIARLLGIGRYKREFPDSDDIRVVAKESKRKIIQVQEPNKWEFI